MTKEALHQKYRQIRLIMAPRIIEQDSIIICRKLFREVDWSKIKKVCSYDPILDLKEVDIKPLLEYIEYKYPDIKIKLLPQRKNQKTPKTKFDLILVPCLAFDKDNYRLGWGGGFYDKFLANQPQALKIGLCFTNGMVKKGLPHEPHDIPLDKIITEELPK
jgi:5-formyltetrahydrofolate cyclo-ligase